jgi:hypothetical protein
VLLLFAVDWVERGVAGCVQGDDQGREEEEKTEVRGCFFFVLSPGRSADLRWSQILDARMGQVSLVGYERRRRLRGRSTLFLILLAVHHPDLVPDRILTRSQNSTQALSARRAIPTSVRPRPPFMSSEFRSTTRLRFSREATSCLASSLPSSWASPQCLRTLNRRPSAPLRCPLRLLGGCSRHFYSFFYRERGVWVLIMIALTSTQYIGDTTFGFVSRFRPLCFVFI